MKRSAFPVSGHRPNVRADQVDQVLGASQGVVEMQGWRTRAEVAKELGITERTLQRRLAELGIRPARPGRIAMLSDEDVTKLMEESRERGRSSKAPLSAGATGQRSQGGRELLMDLQDVRRILDGGS